MNRLNTSNTHLILMEIYKSKSTPEGKRKVNMTSIINYGEVLEGGYIQYLTREGVQVYPVETVNQTPIEVVSFDVLDLNHLMSDWSSKNKNQKPIVLDESIETHEVYDAKFGRFRVMIERRENVIAIKPLFEEL